jgi:hypothetical protein
MGRAIILDQAQFDERINHGFERHDQVVIVWLAAGFAPQFHQSHFERFWRPFMSAHKHTNPQPFRPSTGLSVANRPMPPGVSGIQLGQHPVKFHPENIFSHYTSQLHKYSDLCRYFSGST